MKLRRNLLRKLTVESELNTLPLPGIPLVELAGDERVLVEYHQGITEYSDERICVLVKYGYICVCGKGLALSSMTSQQLVITGKINSVSILRGRK